MKRLLTTRRYFGLGDWVMMQSALKAVNRCYPDLAIDLDVTKVPLWFQLLVLNFDARVAFVRNPNPAAYDYVSGHVIYAGPRPIVDDRPIHLIDSMVRNISKKTGLLLQWSGELASYTGYTEQHGELPKHYVLMSNKGNPDNPRKDWAKENFEDLANKLAPDIPIVQIGRRGDTKIQAATYCGFDLSPMGIQAFINGATVVVSIENGISHWAGHLGKNTVTLYLDKGGCLPAYTGYPHQVGLTDEVISVGAVHHQVLRLLDKEITVI